MRKWLPLLVTIILIAGIVYGAGTLTITGSNTRNTLNRMVLDWVTPSTGLTTSALTANIYGYIYRVTIVPDTTGGTEPNTLFDVQLQDADGIDLLDGEGSNCPNTVATSFSPTISDATPAVCGTVSVVVTNAGKSKSGQIVVYYRKTD